MNKILVIGAGIHGLTVAHELAKNGFQVTIIDKESEVMKGTSGATHNRAHLGYHYPRSIETGKECIAGLRDFEGKYPDCILYQDSSFYLIEKDSLSSVDEYRSFCDELNIHYEEVMPSTDFIKSDRIVGSFLTHEPIIHVDKLKNKLLIDLYKSNVNIIIDCEFIHGKRTVFGIETIFSVNGNKQKWVGDYVINATYAFSNNVLSRFGYLNYLPYKLQHTEIAIVESEVELPSLTIMDGKFISIMKYASDKPNQYLIYDAKHSIRKEYRSDYIKSNVTLNSGYEKMQEKMRLYFPFADDLKYIDSTWGTRPIPIKTVGDSRETNIRCDGNFIYSICEGKFISATLMANKITLMIKEKNGNI